MARIGFLKRIKLIHRFYNRINPPTGTILMLHRVTPNRSKILSNRLLEVSPDFLNNTIEYYKKKNVQFVTIDTAYKIQQGLIKTSTPYICFTFDDGFKDNLTEAFPIFKKHNVPFTIYISTDFPDGKACIWWYELEYLLNKREKIILPTNKVVECDNGIKKNYVFNLLSKYIMKDANEKNNEFIKLIFKLNGLTEIRMPDGVDLLNWNEIKELHLSGLCSIQSHGISHLPLNQLDDYTLFRELKYSQEKIEDCIQSSVKHFAYPHGIYSSRVVKFTSNCGYLTAVKVGGGMQRLNQRSLHYKRKILIEP